MNRVWSAGKVAAVGGSVRALDEDLLSAEELDMDIVLVYGRPRRCVDEYVDNSWTVSRQLMKIDGPRLRSSDIE
ncbi:hypothetical protein VCV18_009953 [Metarhizium anisopliae]